jgi:hypothetical protein
MNGFSTHDIKHTSPSSINMWASAPCAWVAKYLLGRSFNFSHAARAGTLAEEAVVNVLCHGWTEGKAIEEAVAEYNKGAAFGCSDADLKRGAAIPGMITNTIAELKGFGEPEMGTDLVYGKKQKKIELLCKTEEWSLPIIGYLDFFFRDHNLVVDLKTSMRKPSVMSDEHKRQGAIYRAAMGNASIRFLYVTGKDFVWHEIDDPAPVLAETKEILKRQERFLRLGDAELLQSVVPVAASSFYWSSDSDLRKELYSV